MKALGLIVLAACSSSYSPPDLSGITVNNHGLDASIDEALPDGPNAVLASDPLLSFGKVLTNTRSTTIAATVSNTGGPSVITSVMVTGANAAAFVIDSETCVGNAVDATTTCAAQVRFAPQTAAVLDATLEVHGSASGSALVALKGTGVATGALQLTPPAGAFGNVATTATFDVALQLQNVGTTPSGSITLDVTGPDAGMFQLVANNCAGLAANATCGVTVRFSPTLLGARSATLTATDAWGGSMTAALAGTGT